MTQSNSLAGRPPLLAAAVALLLLGRVLALFLLADNLANDPDGYRLLADNVRAHATFGFGNRPTAYRPPLYPLLLVPFVATPRPAFAIALLHLFLGAATIGLTYRLARRWRLAPGASLLAAALVAWDPILLHQSTLVMTETLATLLAVLALLALTRLSDTGTTRDAALAGTCLALAALARPTFLVVFALALVAWPLLAPRARWLPTSAALLVAASVVLAPWVVRNWIHFGRPIVATTHGGYTLLLANNPSYYDYLRNAPWGAVWDPADFHAELALELPPPASPIDELAGDRRLRKLAVEHIRNEPAIFLWSCVVRVGNLYSPLPHAVGHGESPGRRALRYLVAAWYVALYGVALVGVVSLGRALYCGPWLWGLTLLAAFTLVHAVYWSNLRMRAPLMPVLALLAAAGCAVLWTRSSQRNPLPGEHFEPPCVP